MFSRRRDASKVALVHLVARLIAGGYRLLDAQFMTEHLGQFGAQEIGRTEYHRRLARALTADASFYALVGGDSGSGALGSGAGGGSGADFLGGAAALPGGLTSSLGSAAT